MLYDLKNFLNINIEMQSNHKLFLIFLGWRKPFADPSTRVPTGNKYHSFTT